MAIIPWTFTPFPPLPPTFLPNMLFYNATSPSSNVTYQISLSYPFEWGPSSLPTTEITNKTALTIYVTDGNALAMTAAEHLKRSKPVDATQPDALVVGIGYPLTDNVYALTQRSIDFNAPIPGAPVPSGADIFINFIDFTLRPWVQNTIFPGVNFTRDAVYGHSSGGIFVTYALITRPDLFDTFIAASPSLTLNNGTIMGNVTRRLGDGMEIPGEVEFGQNQTRPAVFIGYGELEDYPLRKRTQTEEQFQGRRGRLQRFSPGKGSHELFDRLVGSGKMRDVVVKEYAGMDHARVGGSALLDGIAYFLDW
ncbi:Alpha/Beta hydrolase protein [Triangularia verruculosa]|uniref:Alpha/Beta hydrolase protein n=1 Tax=Triangularia verruculosa TaxID=2587418 RepID=A0AAN7AXY6_9PEZI|nr:Alpha/Beta hydrolase protein [Triangularia verruculosa]